MIAETITATGKVALTLLNAHGEVKQQLNINNMVVGVGKSLIASRLVGTTSNVMTHMAIGSSTSSPTLSDTTLGAAISGGRVALVSSTVGGNEITYSTTFLAGSGTGRLAELGLFNSSTAGTMLARTTFNAFDKLAGDILDVVWTITIN